VRKIFGLKTVLAVIVVFLILSLAANAFFVWQFEATRRRHVEAVYGGFLWLHDALSHAACGDMNDYSLPRSESIDRTARHMRLQEVFTHLHSSFNTLAVHHRYRAGRAEFFYLQPILTGVFSEDDPTIHLQILTDKISEFNEGLELNMPTQELFGKITDINEALRPLFITIRDYFREREIRDAH
jgi:hypothetical protein